MISIENGFLFLDEMLHNIRWDAEYTTWDNFTGKPADGYEVSRITGTRVVVFTLHEAQIHATVLGCSLLLWDGYRPRTTVDCFPRWTAQPEDNLTKEKFYPNIEQAGLITKGHVTSQSSHSCGSAISLTLYHLNTGELASMGSNLNFTDGWSRHTAKGVGGAEA